jgi:ADP-heptose:LPS heptosyltransferase
MSKTCTQLLVIRPGALGDVLLTLPALQALQEAIPGAIIEVMGTVSNLEWLPGRSVVGAVSSFDRADLAALFQPDAAVPPSLQTYINGFAQIISYVTPASHVFACNLSRAASGVVLHFDARPKTEIRLHMSDYLQQPLRELGIEPRDDPPQLSLRADDSAQAARYWLEQGLAGVRVVALHPGSGSPAKNWPARHFAAVARHLHLEYGARLLWVQGPADGPAVQEARAAAGEIEGAALHGWSIPSLAAILSRCDLYVGNDSGVSHLAAAVGTPTVTIFGPTDPQVWAPRGRRVRIVQAALPCAPCPPQSRRACQGRLCLQQIPVPTVLQAALSLAGW